MQYANFSINDVNCPFCLNKNGFVLYKITNEESAIHFIKPWQDYNKFAKLCEKISLLWGQPFCEVVKCQECEGVFSWPFVSGDEIFYNLIKNKLAQYPRNKWEFSASIEFCNNYHPLPKSGDANILEMGAGNGDFIRKLISAGLSSKLIYATEYGEDEREKIKSIAEDIKIGTDELIQYLLNNMDEQFSHIFLFQVMEHIGNLDENFKLFKILLIKNGRLFFSVPNDVFVEFAECNGLELDMPPNHISRFSNDAIHKLASRHDLSIELLEDEPFSFKENLRQFIVSKYFRQSQLMGTIANLIDRFFNRENRKFGMILFSIIVLPLALIKISLGPKVGISKLAILRKV